jgi:enterobactin synthetase component F
MGNITLPLTTAQRGMWVGQQIAPKDAIFNLAEAIELHGAIDATSLREALRQVTREMETLRVRIVQHGLMPQQVVLSEFEGAIPLLDFSSADIPRDAALRWMTAELAAPVDFKTSPVWVSAVLKVSDESWFWYHRAHHIMLDGFSGGLVVQRVAELYTALRQRRAPSPTPFGPLSTLVESEAAYRKSERYATDRVYWMERMANLPEPVTLARRFRQSCGGLLRSTALLLHEAAEELYERVKGMNVSLPQALIALVAAYYFRITGAKDLVFGLPVTARAGGRMRRCPGMVANAVPIRLAMSADDTFDSLFTQTSRAVREALRHQQYRYEDLRRDLGLLNQDKQIARLGINIEPFDYELTFDGVRATPHNLSNAHMEDLTVFIYDRMDGSGLRIDFDANPALYHKAELDAHQRRLRRLIESATMNPDAHLGDVDILDPGERACVTRDWNDTADPETIPALFARQARRTPDALAVIVDDDSDRALTYRALAEQSLALARRLAQRGIGPGDIVAVALPRAETLPVAILGILRTGAAYLPLEPDGPAERLSAILADANPVCVLTSRACAQYFEQASVARLLIDDVADGTADPSALQDLDMSETAYVIYTSGSTGRPKGVEVSHRSLSNLVEAMRRLLRPRPSDRWLAVTTITFDIAGLELFLPLVVGARVVIASRDAILDPLALGRLIETQGITLLQATPSFWRMMLTNRDVSLSSVHALVGGEALSGELAGRLLARTRKVTNLYGPTETTIWSTTMDLSDDDIDPPPIGRPVLNTRVYVLDGQMRPVPVGVTGALYIGGAGVAKGYLNRPMLTDERFLADQFVRDGSRFYHTGDLARWREDGVLEYLGRSDQQIKIRGHRIEPGEIEFHLVRHEAVAAAVVAARPGPAGEPTLIAYVVAADAAPSPEMLRQYLADRVPAYMMPSTFVMLEALPQTPNGKVDRKALPAPSWTQEKHIASHAAPRSETERQLVAIWEDILHRDDIGILDNFFEFGGDSLTATELFMAIAEKFSQEIPFASLFRTSTIAGLAALLDAHKADDPLETLLPLKTGGSKPPLFCIHPIIGLGWPYASLMRHLDPDRPLYALQALGLRSGDPSARSVEEMASRYLADIHRAQPHGPYHLLGWSFGGLIAHAIAGQLRADGEEVAFLVMLDSYPFVIHTDAGAADEARQVELALEFLGLPPPAEQPVSSMTALADHLCVQYDLLSQPLVQAVLRTETDIMERIGRVVRENLAAAYRYDPAPVDVDVLFCHAAERTTSRLDGVVDYRPDAWRSRVRSLSVHDIACHHQDMLSPRAAERIGAIMRHMTVDSRASGWN